MIWMWLLGVTHFFGSGTNGNLTLKDLYRKPWLYESRTSSEVELMETRNNKKSYPIESKIVTHFFGSGTNGNLFQQFVSRVVVCKSRTSSEVELMETLVW